MKKFICTSILTVLIASLTAVSARNYPEEYLGLPGDNLNLYATMKLFQESETLEAFERDLNDEKSKINNLDLNGDNLVDYITVTDYVDGNAHTIVLRTALNNKESQDVAVFTVQNSSRTDQCRYSSSATRRCTERIISSNPYMQKHLIPATKARQSTQTMSTW